MTPASPASLLSLLASLSAHITIASLAAHIIITALSLPQSPLLTLTRSLPHNLLPPATIHALTLSLVSPKTAAASLAHALSHHKITPSCAMWSALMLPFPPYALRRWPLTFLTAMSTAGTAGMIFALSLLIRSFLRFLLALYMVKRSYRPDSADVACYEVMPPDTAHFSLTACWKRLLRTLPAAWIMFTAGYMLSRVIEAWLHERLKFWGLPIVAASMGNVTAALSLAGGAVSAGAVTDAQAVFALILGSGLGTFSRTIRQDAGYYYGLFPKKLATMMLVMNLATILPLIAVNLIFAGLALSLWA